MIYNNMQEPSRTFHARQGNPPMPRKATTAQPPAAPGALDQSELKKYPGYFLARARYIAFKTFDRHIGAQHQLNPVEFSLMLLVSSNVDVTLTQLSQALGVAPPNMTGIMRRLETRGLVQRTPAPQDRRMHHITLTRAGTALIAQAHAVGRTMDKSWLGRLTKAEQAMLVELLDKLALAAPGD